MNPWKQIEIAGYILAALLVIYFPPKLAAAFRGFGDFIERHFGDSIGVYLLHLGIGLIILGDAFPVMTHAEQIGNSLVLTAMGVLKLKTVPGGNGNGGGSISETVTSTRTTDPPPDPAAAAAPVPAPAAPAIPKGWGPTP